MLIFIGHLVLDRISKVSKNQFSTLFVWNTVGFWHSEKNVAEWVGSGPSMKWKHGGCVAAPRKTADMGSPVPLDACFMQIPPSESLFFPFSSQKRQI